MTTKYQHNEFATDQAFLDRCQALPIHVVYGQLTGSELWGQKMQKLVPEHMRMGFLRYVAYGSRSNSGSFLQALVNNDLMGAYRSGDHINLANMRNWITFLCNCAPVGCYGHSDAYQNWTGILSERDR